MTGTGRDAPIRRTGLLVRDVGDDLLVYDAGAARTHLLNPTASAIWQACDGDRSVSQLTADLAARFQADPDAIDPDVRATLDQFFEAGLLVDPGADAAPAPAPAVAETAVAGEDPAGEAATPPSFDDLPETSAVFDIAGVALRYHGTDADLIDYLCTVLDPLRIPEDHLAGRDVEHVIVEWSGSETEVGHVWLGDALIGRPTSARSVASLLLWDINRIAVRSAERLSFHAGAAAHPGGIVLLPASPDSGKSTLTLGLVSAGWTYLGDEAFAVDLADRRIVPYLKPLTLDPGSWTVFPQVEPQVPERQQRFLHEKWHVDMRRIGGGVASAEQPFVMDDITTIIFPTFCEGADTEIEELTPSAVAVALAENAFNLAKGGEAAVGVLADLAEHASGFRLRHGGSEEAVAAVRRLVASAGDL